MFLPFFPYFTVLLDLIEDVDHSEAQVVIIATAQNKQQLNKDLLQSRGVHVFEKILEINPPSLVCIVVYICMYSDYMCTTDSVFSTEFIFYEFCEKSKFMKYEP